MLTTEMASAPASRATSAIMGMSGSTGDSLAESGSRVRARQLETMRRTLHWVFEHWDWPSTWGWDYPMVAMTAARLGEPERAIDALLLDTPKNTYRANGHNHQRPGLTLYLPGNGGLLTAVAMMAAGWDGAPPRHAPGFPVDRWTVRWEGLRPLP